MDATQLCESPQNDTATIGIDVRSATRKQARVFIDSKLARELVREFLEPSPLIYWSDFTSTLLAAATAIIFAFALPFPSLPWALACIIASLASYRLLIFSHELAHLRPSLLPGFKFAWNMLVGIPLLMPSICYVGMHDDHHRTKSYGTEADPEYRPFAGARADITLFTVYSILIYPLLGMRFFILAPIGLIVPSFHDWLARKASSFTMNPRYERRMTAAEQRELRWVELALLVFWSALAGVLLHLNAEAKFLIVYLAIVQPVALINSLRTLAAHRYETDGHSRGKHEQVLDSVDIPGGAFSALWAPVGLRYHALHHYFPTIPYHNLGLAYRRIVAALPADNDYRATHSKGLWNALFQLWTAKAPAVTAPSESSESSESQASPESRP